MVTQDKLSREEQLDLIRGYFQQAKENQPANIQSILNTAIGSLSESNPIASDTKPMEDNRTIRIFDEEDHETIPQEAHLFSPNQFEELFLVAHSCLIALENNQKDTAGALNFLKNNNIERILYKNHPIQGSTMYGADKLTFRGYYGVAISGLIAILFTVVTWVDTPLWLDATSTGLFMGAMCYLSGLFYGVLNDLFAAKACLPYFLFGHIPFQRSVLPTNNIIAQAGSWGVVATLKPVFVASIAFTIAGAVMASRDEPTALFVMPALMALMPILALLAEIIAKTTTSQNPTQEINSLKEENVLDQFQVLMLNQLSTEKEKVAFMGNFRRNRFGYLMVPLAGILGLVAYIQFSRKKGPDFIDGMHESTLFNFTLPIVCAATAFLALAAVGIYTYMNQQSKVNNRYNVDFSVNRSRETNTFDIPDEQAKAFRAQKKPNS